MKQSFLLLAIFFFGFLSGSLWQTLQQNLQPISVAPPIPLQPETVTMKIPDSNKQETKKTEEEKMSQALTDPDFKRVHDFLMLEKPIQMKLGQPKPQTQDLPLQNLPQKTTSE
jgi:hypothetical protein